MPRTPLHECHREAGAKIVPFAGWEMPIQYESVIAEHRAVREHAGLFDVSHMGEVAVRGAGAVRYLDAITPNHVAKLAPGRAHYSGLLTEAGTYVDDLLVYRLGEQEFLVVVNASNRDKDVAWMRNLAPADVEVEDVSDRYALLALQGPRAVAILAPLTDVDLSGLRYYGFATGAVDGHQAIVSRTGYTGEDGFELYVARGGAGLWRRLLDIGGHRGWSRPASGRATPCGSRRAWRSTATSSTRRRRPGKPASTGWSSSTRGTSSAATPSCGSASRACLASSSASR
jgi:aminomethyltransferase